MVPHTRNQAFCNAGMNSMRDVHISIHLKSQSTSQPAKPNQTEPNKNKNKTPNETCANTSIRTHIRGTNLIEMESAKLKIKIISIG